MEISLNQKIIETEQKIKEINIPISRLKEKINNDKNLLRNADISKVESYKKPEAERLINEVKQRIKFNSDELDKVEKELKPIQEPLIKVYHSLLQERERKEYEKEKKYQNRLQKKLPINLKRWLSRCGDNYPPPYQIVWLANKREQQVLRQVCQVSKFRITHASKMTQYKQRKYRKNRLSCYGRGFYLIPR